jgi:repressor LexA
MENLPRRQQEVFNFIKTYIAEKGYCPALTDVARGLGLANSTVTAYISALKQKKYITSDFNVARSLRVAKASG